MQSLLQVLRGEPLTPEPEWEVMLAVAQQEHVLAFVVDRLLLSGVPLPAEIRPRVLAAQREAAVAAFFWTAQLTGLLREFAAAGIAVIPLKGPWLAERVYGGVARRVSRDLDLLVRTSDYAAAESLLARIGFTPAARADDYHRQWHRGTAVVELHFDIENPLAIDFHIAGAWEQSQESVFHGQPCRRLAPADELLFLCIHGVRHRFERLSLALDIALASAHFAGSDPTPRREVARLDRLLLLGQAMARHLQSGVATTGSGRMQTLADGLWRELMTAPQPTLDWQAQHRFFLETELTPGSRLFRRAAHLRIAATRLIEADFAYAAGLGMKRRWQVWLLRPLRLVFERPRR